MNNYKKWQKIESWHISEKLKSLTAQKIESAFSGSLTFGTAGLRGVMELGTARMNEVNVCKLANVVLRYFQKKKLSTIVIGYDTRNNSKTYAKIFAKVMANGGINVNNFFGFVPTPVLVYSVTETNSDMGVMITASHNNKNYNGIKLVGNDGLQLCGVAEKEINNLYQKLDEVELYNEYLKKISNKRYKNIKTLSSKIKKKFLGNFYKNKINNSLNIIYTPLNGTAYEYVMTALKGTGFKNIKTPFKQKFASGEFKTCPSPNPEYEETFKQALKCTDVFDADIIVASDPDGDRLGAMIKSTKGYKLLTGNEIGFLLLNYMHENKAYEKNHFAISTVVSSPMFFEMCEKLGIKYSKTLTGFKNIGKEKQKQELTLGKDGFLLAYEESCGYIVKESMYDKDGIFSLLKLCELASFLKNQGSSVEEYLNNIYSKYGNIYSLNSHIVFNGDNALEKMNTEVNNLRASGLKSLNKKKIIETIDYLNDNTGLQPSNFIEYKTKTFTFIIRPSGTEPKLKFYIHAKGNNLDDSKKLANEVLEAIKKEIFGL